MSSASNHSASVPDRAGVPTGLSQQAVSGKAAHPLRKKVSALVSEDAVIDLINLITDLADVDALDKAPGEVRYRLEEFGVHVAKALKAKPKVSRKGLYVKGREYEYELRDHFVSYGLNCRRVIQSGGGIEKDDLVLTTGWGEEYRLEAKRRAKLPGYLINEGCHATVFRMDRGESLVLVPLSRFTELVQCR